MPAFETRNGQMCAEANRQAAALARKLGKIAIGGSDSHTMRGVGRTYTEVAQARSIAEFFAGLRAKRGRVRGADGTCAGLTADVYRIIQAVLQEKPATLALLPLAVLVPVFTAGHWMNEKWFCRKWATHFEDAHESPRMLWDMRPGAERI